MKIVNGIHQINVPVPFPLAFVNCYLIEGGKGWSIVDTGLNYPEARAVWESAFRELGIAPEQIAGIYITHYHPDHYGLAGWLQQLSGAKVYIHEIDAARADMFWSLTTQDRISALGELFSRNGMPQDLVQQILAQTGRMREFVRPRPEVNTLKDGEEVLLGDSAFQVMWTPGHSDGHICLYNPVRGILLAGDHLLPTISPNVSLWPGCDPNPLSHFLDSLKKLEELDIQMVLPAHGPVFNDARYRVRELLEHHRDRSSLMVSLAGEGRTAYEVCMGAFDEGLSVHERRFAMGETLAHLEYLVSEGVLERLESNPVRYRKRC